MRLLSISKRLLGYYLLFPWASLGTAVLEWLLKSTLLAIALQAAHTWVSCIFPSSTIRSWHYAITTIRLILSIGCVAC